MNKLETLLNEKQLFFDFMKEKYPIFNNSNIFLRDIQYAILSFFDKRDIKISYSEAEKMTYQFSDFLEKTDELTRLNHNTWKVNFLKNEHVAEVENE